jgi:hypothetical protein
MADRVQQRRDFICAKGHDSREVGPDIASGSRRRECHSERQSYEDYIVAIVVRDHRPRNDQVRPSYAARVQGWA